MQKTIFLIIATLFITSTAYAQKSVCGKVTDDNNNGILHANVALFSADSVFIDGSSTNNNGEFLIQDPNGAGAIMRVTCLGFNETTVNTDGSGFYHIKLKEKSEMLDEVVVTHKDTQYKLEGDKLITAVKNTPLEKLGTLSNILSFVPGVISTNGGISVFGKGKPTFYINNKKVRSSSDLELLDVKDIISIELIKNPGSQYSGTSRAAINIKTARKPGEGLSIYNVNWLQMAHKVSAQELMSLNYRSKKFDVFGTFNLSHISGYQDTESSYDIQSSTPLKRNNRTKAFTPRNIAEIYAGFDYYLTKNNSFGMKYGHTYMDIDGRINAYSNVFSNGMEDDTQTYLSVYEIPKNTDRVSAYYQGWIKNKVKMSINSEYLSIRDKDNTCAYEVSENFEDRTVTTRNRTDYDIFASDMSLQYTWKKENQLFGGIEYLYTHRNYMFDNKEELLENVDGKINQNIFGAYLGCNIVLNKLKINMGLRYEHYRFNTYNNNVLSKEQSKKYNDIYPSISLSYPFGKLRTSLSYSIKTEKPSYYNLNSNLQYDSRNVYNGGNPFLQPTKTHDLQLLMQYGIATLTLDYIHQKDLIVEDLSLYDDATPILLKSYANYPSTNICQAFLTLQKKIGIWNPNLSLGLIYENFKIKYNNGTVRRLNNPHATFHFDNTISLPHNWDIWISANVTTEGNTNVHKLGSSNRVTVSLTKSWKNMSLLVMFNDIFKSYKIEDTTLSNVCKNWARAYIDTYNIQIRLRINLNSSYSKYRGHSAASKEEMRTW